MTTISMTEFAARLQSIAADLMGRHPKFRLYTNECEIWLRGGSCSGVVELKIDPAAKCLRPVVSFCSGTAPMGSLANVAALLDDFCDLHAALVAAEAALAGLVVVPDTKTEAAS